MLAASHEALGCASCHVGDAGEVTNAKCLGCHDHAPLRARIAANLGYHATAGVRGQPCQACHRDHKGRVFDMRGWDAVAGGEAGFDHGLTGWPLRDQHAIACERCHMTVDHQRRHTYNGLDRTCTACHAQAHRMFELGAHADLTCDTCHTAALGARLPDAVCHKCHVDDSPHGDRFKRFGPPACGACHRATGWDRIVFNHELQTRFPLVFLHDGLDCRACHRGDGPADFERFKPKLTCKGCHAHAQVHADADHPNGRFTSKECLMCHVAPGQFVR